MYTLEEIILDQSFVNYCHKSNEADVLRWQNYAEESAEHAAQVAEAGRMVMALNLMLKSREEKVALEEFKALVRAGQGENAADIVVAEKRARFTLNRMWYAAAASVLLVAGAILFYQYRNEAKVELALQQEQQQYRIYKSPLGERLNITLPDRSKVVLNANTVLKVPHSYNKDNRKIVLLGAAYFEVSPNASLPFVIESNDMKATVLGTSFYMRAYPHESGQQIELLTGKLKVQKSYTSETDNKPEILGPGEMVMLNRSVDLMEKETFDVQTREAWIKGQLKFNNTSFNGVVSALEDWYGVPFEIRGKQKSAGKFSGTYENESLERVLNIFCFATDCSFKIEKDKVVIDFN
ncbi:FecR family protein [Pedobacter caeni]|uniref:FecR family protein n=1 Tax=Pedobacter caeni TaxID=288992 RepID=A0A1M5LIP5_9SPHI|nr:FecR domain-containing protein [Pedobacter caeni]SHG64539.1 FecR family protein [Pedobacter caeni]